MRGLALTLGPNTLKKEFMNINDKGLLRPLRKLIITVIILMVGVLGYGQLTVSDMYSPFVKANAVSAVSQGATKGTSVFLGTLAGPTSIGDYCVGIGLRTMLKTTSGYNITSVGYEAGRGVTAGHHSVYIGTYAGAYDTLGYNNTYVGEQAGFYAYSRSFNTLIGKNAGQQAAGGNSILIGVNSGILITGDSIVSVGNFAGSNSNTGGVYLGYRAGQNEAGSHKLYIENTNSVTPLIWGDFLNDSLKFNGATHVEGNLTVSGTFPSDFVFYKDYKLPSFSSYLSSAKDLQKLPEFADRDRHNIGEYLSGLEEAIEKQLLFMEEQNERIAKLEKKIKRLRK